MTSCAGTPGCGCGTPGSPSAKPSVPHPQPGVPAQLVLDEALDAQFWDYLIMAAHSLINVEPAHGRPDLGLKPA